MAVPVIVIFDAGKTNKKLLLFNEQYRLLQEDSVQLEEIIDEDGFPCEDVEALKKWIQQKFSEVLKRKDIDIKAVNFSAYGASLVYVDAKGNVIAPLYNYLKPFPELLKKKFYDTYGGETKMAMETASPVLGSLNSGMQLYRIKQEQPGLFEKISFAFHLPQYLSYILTDFPAAEITSIGCHTGLWDFQKNKYHSWVVKEGIDKKFAAALPSSSTMPATFQGREIQVGIGLHDSSAALIPYLASFHEPFILISTGTWCISLNPFNHAELTSEELKQDCLCYLSYQGKPVKASRLFAGYEHEQQIKRLATHFGNAVEKYLDIEYDAAVTDMVQKKEKQIQQLPFSEVDLDEFRSYEEAYHYLMNDITKRQVKSTSLVMKGAAAKRIFVDGGFGKNAIYMNLLAKNLPGIEVYAATILQASALGSALAIHKHWNQSSLPSDLVELKYYANTEMNKSI